MLFDINAALGHWPFRKVSNETPAGLRALLAGKGIGGAAVVNTHGLFYKNCHDANTELADWIADHLDFFVGVATLNPRYAAWERDLCACKEELGFRALRLAPQYHDYRLGDADCVAIAKAATELGLPILVPHRVVDVRQRHWLDTDRTNGPEEIRALCDAVPEARVVVTDSYLGGAELVNADGSPRHPGLYLDSRCGAAGLPEEVAAERIVFGTGAPFRCVTPSLLSMEAEGFGEATRRRIGYENAHSLLRLPGWAAVEEA